MIHQRFGRLTVVEKTGKKMHRQQTYKVRCDCGMEFILKSSNIASNVHGCVRCNNARPDLKVKRRAWLNGTAKGAK